MASFIDSPVTQTRTFQVPFQHPLPGAPFAARGVVLLETQGPAARPVRLTLRYFPDGPEFRRRLPAIAAGTGWAGSLYTLGHLADRTGWAVDFEAPSELLARVPSGLRDLEAVLAFLESDPVLLRASSYRFTGLDLAQDAG